MGRSRLMLPLLSITPVRNNSASSEIRPLPQIPRGFAAADHPVGRLKGLAVDPDFLDRALVARMPCTTPAPSKAGPAEQAQVTSQSRLPSTISPLVPTSINSVNGSVVVHPRRQHARRDIRADITGDTRQAVDRCLGMDVQPDITGAIRVGIWLTAVTNGDRRMLSAGMPSSRWIIVLLPAIVALTISLCVDLHCACRLHQSGR